jgi:hypothetical protein
LEHLQFTHIISHSFCFSLFVISWTLKSDFYKWNPHFLNAFCKAIFGGKIFVSLQVFFLCHIFSISGSIYLNFCNLVKSYKPYYWYVQCSLMYITNCYFQTLLNFYDFKDFVLFLLFSINVSKKDKKGRYIFKMSHVSIW